jgi:hypothetical protein
VRAAACQWPPPAPPDLHPQLIAHPATRASVAEYTALTTEFAFELARDEDEMVRIRLAKNPQLPDPEPMVCASLIYNQNTPESVRARLHAKLAEEREQKGCGEHPCLGQNGAFGTNRCAD